MDPIEENDKILESISKDVVSDDEEKEDSAGKTADSSKKLAYSKEDESKTIFVGNIPNESNINETRIKELFLPYGSIKSVRFRSENGKIIYSKKSRRKCKSFIAYVVFEKEEDAQRSIELNGFKLSESFLRVNMANDKKSVYNPKGTIFVGNLKFDVKSEEVHEYFSKLGAIDYVRIIPNKGIAYVAFKKGVQIASALKLNGKNFNGRPLRIEKYTSKEKQEKKKLFKRDPKTGRVLKVKAKKPTKIHDEKFLRGRSNNNPIIKKIKETQKAKFNKFSQEQQISKKDLFKKNNVEIKVPRKVDNKKKEFFGQKVRKVKKNKNKVSKGAKEKKMIIKKLQFAGKMKKIN